MVTRGNEQVALPVLRGSHWSQPPILCGLPRATIITPLLYKWNQKALPFRVWCRTATGPTYNHGSDFGFCHVFHWLAPGTVLVTVL